MLYAFRVDTGTMMTFEMSLALESVNKLKEHIEKVSHIPVKDQVLLINGGIILDLENTVCSYSAGTDTNPIFLFDQSIKNSTGPPQTNKSICSYSDLKAKVKEYSNLEPSFTTLEKRSRLAQSLVDAAKEQVNKCSNLVWDQHLQHQGWSAVLANLEDTTLDFRKQYEYAEKNFAAYFEQRDTYLALLQNFHEDLKILQRIPLLSTLLKKDTSVTSSELDPTGEENLTSSNDTNETTSLFEWIASDESKPVETIFDTCSLGLQRFDEHMFQSFKEEADKILITADDSTMREIKGLGERLEGLEALMMSANKLVQEQTYLAKQIVKNQIEATNIRDTSILPDLCMSHRQQLEVMEKNHDDLNSILLRCTKAKNELCFNLHLRIKWVIFVEDCLAELNSRLVMYNGSLNRLCEHMRVVQQIHLTPATYLSAVAEVVRRRAFSESFLVWASNLACHLLAIHNEEVKRRNEFKYQYEYHFLMQLFPGMDDLPPPFATKAPTVFDEALPKITAEDVERLKLQLPDLADYLELSESSSAANFFEMKSFVKRAAELVEGDVDSAVESGDAKSGLDVANETIDNLKAVDENLVQVVNLNRSSTVDRNVINNATSEPCLTTAHGLPHLKDIDRGCESETDTEEFEKVGQSPLELHFDKDIPSPKAVAAETQDASTLTEDNLQISRSEYEKLKSLQIRMNLLVKQTICQLRSEFNDIRTNVLNMKEAVDQDISSIGSSWASLLVGVDNQERQTLDQVRQEYDQVLEDFSKQIVKLEMLNCDMESAMEKQGVEVSSLQEEIQKSNAEHLAIVEQLEIQLKNKEVEMEKAIKDVTDKLSSAHKAEIESIRSRFKLMTMEKSPSDNSLEKVGDYSSLPNHESIIMQITQTFEEEKERVIKEAVSKENEKLSKYYMEKIDDLENKLREKETIISEIRNQVSEDKEKQIEALTEQVAKLNLECVKYKDMVKQLMENGKCRDSELQEQIESLEKEKDDLKKKLEVLERDSNLELITSVAVIEGKSDACTSPMHTEKQPITKSDSIATSSSNFKVTVDSCKTGEMVLILWDYEHENFKIFQESSKYIYFLHPDSLSAFGLELKDGKPNKTSCIGEVVDKEYCHAKKAENRYKVPKGSRFFRVQARPVTIPSKEHQSSRNSSLIQSHNLSQSQIVSSSRDLILDEKNQSSLPSSPTRLCQSAILERVDENAEQMSEIPEELRPASVEKNFGDSGIVDNVEQAMAAGETYGDDSIDSVTDKNETTDRCLVIATDNIKIEKPVSGNWFEMMFSRVFSKNEKI